MAKVADEMKEKNVSREDQGAVLVDFTQLLPGKEGKRLGTTVLRYASLGISDGAAG
jgi:arginyl-tRNA synthetase